MSTATIAAETVETTALAPHQPAPLALAHGSAFALARLSDTEFRTVMDMAKKGRARVQEVMRAMMTPGVHYGHIPGTPAGRPPTLLQPGAQLLRQMFRLVAEPLTTIQYGDGVTAPHITVTCRCLMHMDSQSGEVVASAEGSANSWEKKYRYNDTARVCPSCGKATIIKGKAEYGGGWLCYGKKGGCGAKWPEGAQEIEGQPIGKIENPDPYDHLNTLLAMAEKRATNRATIAATSSADLFTHDVPGSDDGATFDTPEPPPGFDHPNAPPPATPRPAAHPAAKAAPARRTAAKAAPAPVAASTAEVVDESNGDEVPWPPGDPAAVEKIAAARRRFFAIMDEGVTEGVLGATLKANSPAGQAARRKLLCELLGSTAVEPGEMSAGEWNLASEALDRKITGDTTRGAA